MPGRLGDDPLSRKKLSSAKDAHSAQPGVPAQGTSHNDVFFRRRAEGPQPKTGGVPDNQSSSLEEAANVDERPEITEVTDIMRTAQAAKSTQGAEQLAVPAPVDGSVPPPVEEMYAATEQTPPAIPEPEAIFEPPNSATSEPAAAPSSQPEPQPHKSEGFFKRLFGRLGK